MTDDVASDELLAKCVFCGVIHPDPGNAGWVPSFAVAHEELGPCCPDCAGNYLTFVETDGSQDWMVQDGVEVPDTVFRVRTTKTNDTVPIQCFEYPAKGMLKIHAPGIAITLTIPPDGITGVDVSDRVDPALPLNVGGNNAQPAKGEPKMHAIYANGALSKWKSVTENERASVYERLDIQEESGYTARELRFLYECVCDEDHPKGPFTTTIEPSLLPAVTEAVRYFTNTAIEVIGTDHLTGRLVIQSKGQR